MYVILCQQLVRCNCFSYKKINLLKIVNEINHKKTFLNLTVKDIFDGVDGSCRTPIGALAKIVKTRKQFIFSVYGVFVRWKKIIKAKH